MTLFQIIQRLKDYALHQHNVMYADEGSVYTILNNNPSNRYASFIITQNSHREQYDADIYNFTLFYVDRLVDDLETNRVSVQSIGKEVLGNIIRMFCEDFDLDFPTDINYTVFTERFVDLCAGCYANVSLTVYKGVCDDEDSPVYRPIIKIQSDKKVRYTENGEFVVVPDNDYSAMSSVLVEVDVPEKIVEPKLQEKKITDNGKYFPDNGFDGFASVEVEIDCPDCPEREIRLKDINIDRNGTYNVETGYDGFGTVVVDVSCPESECRLQEKGMRITNNGKVEVLPENGFDGLSKVEIDVDVPETIVEPKLQEKNITNNGEYTPDEGFDGFSKVNVDVPTQIVEDDLFVKYIEGDSMFNHIKADMFYRSPKKITRLFDYNTLISIEFPVCSESTDIPKKCCKGIEIEYAGQPFCSVLRKVVIPEGYRNIDDEAFAWCRIDDLTLPSTLRRIGDKAFYNGIYRYDTTTKRTERNIEITIPYVNHIGKQAFYNCGIQSVNILEVIDSFTIDSGAFMSTNLKTFDVNWSGYKPKKEIILMGISNFGACTWLDHVGDDDTKICFYSDGKDQFNGCMYIKRLNIKGNLDRSFYGCSSLEKFRYYGKYKPYEDFEPAKILYWQDEVFYNCKALTEIEYHTIDLPEIRTDNVFNGLPQNGNFHYMKGHDEVKDFFIKYLPTWNFVDDIENN